jgi:hypothetical protein
MPMSKREQYLWWAAMGLIFVVCGWYVYHGGRLPRTVEDVVGRLGRPRMTPTLRQCLGHHRSSRYFSRSCSGRSGGSPRRTLTKYRSAASAHTRVTNTANIIFSTLPVASRVIGPAVWVMPDARRLGRLFASPGKPDGRQHKRVIHARVQKVGQPMSARFGPGARTSASA